MHVCRGICRRLVRWLSIAATGVLAAGCGRQYVVLHPAGPVAASELHLIETASIAMGVVILFVLGLFAVTVVRFRERRDGSGPYAPAWNGSRRLEALLFAVPLLIVAFLAVPTVSQTFALDRLPPGRHDLVVDVTSFDYKWLFLYPRQRIATVNYVDIPVHTPVLFELTADSPMNTFWVPQLGGMEYAMPGRVLPLYLEAGRSGAYAGRSANFSGVGFAHMVFTVHALSPGRFGRWAAAVRRISPPLTMAGYRGLLAAGEAPRASFSSYPPEAFPRTSHGFTLQGGMYESR